jgi:hypothetical protein
VASIFAVILEDFLEDLAAIRSLVGAFADPAHKAKARVAAANSATLLLAATFEEFVREMARAYARTVVLGSPSHDKLPKDLIATAWKRTLDGLGKIKFDAKGKYTETFGLAQAKFSVIYEFCSGDLSKDIYRDLIHNEMNMRPTQLNTLFKISGLKDVCARCSDKKPILDIFGETEPSKAHGRLISRLDDFFERRNDIAHSLNSGRSNSAKQIETDLDMLISFGTALCQTLEAVAPAPRADPGGGAAEVQA